MENCIISVFQEIFQEKKIHTQFKCRCVYNVILHQHVLDQKQRQQYTVEGFCFFCYFCNEFFNFFYIFLSFLPGKNFPVQLFFFSIKVDFPFLFFLTRKKKHKTVFSTQINIEMFTQIDKHQTYITPFITLVRYRIQEHLKIVY